VAFVKSLGADEVLDYSKTGIREWVNGDKERRGFDCILDCIGGATLADSWQCARTGGRVVSVAEPPDGKRPSEGIATGVEGKWFIVSGSRAQLSRITALIEEGKCKGAVDKVFGLENWGAAFDKVEKGHAKGKVVVRVS
jgi:NADPH:quinone reductase-like Zn-dependent oxidoreductase